MTAKATAILPPKSFADLTEPQQKALRFLRGRDFATPSQIGEALTGGFKRGGYPMKAQGLGRLGGTMGSRLVRMGLAHHSTRNGGYAAYEISAQGLILLAPEA